MLKFLREYVSVQTEKPELNRARFRAMTQQMPLMYGILTINMVGLSATHMHVAPALLTLIIPAVLMVYMVTRTIHFVRARGQHFADEVIRRKLEWTIITIGPAGAVFAAWGVSFLPFGTAEQNAGALFFNGVTTLACAFCLLQLRQAFTLLIVAVIPVTCVGLFLQGSLAFSNAAINLALVSAVLCTVLSNSERDFTQMIIQKREQRRQNIRLQSLNEENHRLANTDSLTGLANRRQFLAEIDGLVEEHDLHEADFVVALLDLDGFKPINDVFGHPAGDQVLIETAARLRKTFTTEDVTIARLGGDEFGLLFRNPGPDEVVRSKALQACMALRKSFHFDEGSANLSATLGMARFPTSANTRSLLFDRADYALYFAKQNAKSEPVFFSHEHERLIFANSAMEQALRDADLEKEMSVEFQPVLDLSCGRTKSLEALARWYSPTLGPVRPDLFIKSAENIGMIGRLTEVLFRKALAEATHWPEHLLLTFNLSAISLTSKRPVMRLMSMAEKVGFPASRIVFEITESAVMKDFDRAMEVLNYIRGTGSHVAIDDFGTGFSSLAYVHRLPIDILKVDRSFIRDLAQNDKSANVLRSILGLCENLNIGCVIEGVETQEQFDLVSDIGGQYIQGYYYSKPLSAGDTHMVLQIEFECESPAILRRAVN